MKKKLLSLALALALCLGLTVPVMAEEVARTETIGGITVATYYADKYDKYPSLSYTGSGALTDSLLEEGLNLLIESGIWDCEIIINIGPGISAPDKNKLVQYFAKQVTVVEVNLSSAPTPQIVCGFNDVKKGDYFADPVAWAVDKKITAGTSETTFSPNENCTVAQILSFLWRAYGSPKYSGGNPFSDVKDSDWFAGAARWAYEKGIISGSTFGGDRPCTRAMAVTYMWKAAGSPSVDFNINKKGILVNYLGGGGDVVIPNGVTMIEMDAFGYCGSLTSVAIPSSVTEIDMWAFRGCNSLTDVYYEGSEAQWKAIILASDELKRAAIHYNSKIDQQPVETGFTDVPGTADYAKAVKWAVDKGITSGTSSTTFSPDSVCTRGQIVSFLYRAMA